MIEMVLINDKDKDQDKDGAAQWWEFEVTLALQECWCPSSVVPMTIAGQSWKYKIQIQNTDTKYKYKIVWTEIWLVKARNVVVPPPSSHVDEHLTDGMWGN